MRRNSSGLIACLLVLATGQAAFAADELCGPLKDFAASVKPGEKRVIRFHTIWGSNFKDRDQPVAAARRCDFEGYEPAKAVCVHLMKSGFMQFAGENAKLAMECFSRKNRFDVGTRIYAISVGLPFDRPGGVGRLDIDLAKNDEVGGMQLTLTANGL